MQLARRILKDAGRRPIWARFSLDVRGESGVPASSLGLGAAGRPCFAPTMTPPGGRPGGRRSRLYAVRVHDVFSHAHTSMNAVPAWSFANAASKSTGHAEKTGRVHRRALSLDQAALLVVMHACARCHCCVLGKVSSTPRSKYVLCSTFVLKPFKTCISRL